MQRDPGTTATPAHTPTANRLFGALLLAMLLLTGCSEAAPSALPNAVDDNYAGSQGVALVINALAGILANDTLEGGSITAPALSPTTSTTAAGGTLELSANGAFTLTPLPGYTGPDTFTYTLENAAGSDTATVSITFTQAPVAVNDAYQTSAGTPLTVPPGAGPPPDLLQNDQLGYPAATISSFGGGSLSGTAATYTVGTTVPVGLGSITVNADGSFSFTPDTGFSGDFQWFYRLANTAGIFDALVTVTVTGPPTAVADPSYLVTSGAPLTVLAPTGLLANDDLGYPSATLQSFGGGDLGGVVTDHAPGATVPIGTGSLSVQMDGSFDFTSDTGFVGIFTFEYRLANASGTSDALVTISVTDAPIAVADTYTTPVGVPLNVPAGIGPPPGLLVNDALGVPAGAIASFGGGVVGGVVTDYAAGTTEPVGAAGSLTVNADGSFSFVPETGLVGLVEFWYRLDNGVGTSDGQVTIDVARQLTIDTSSLPAGDTVTPYDQLIHASGGTGQGYTFTVIAGSLPPGINLVNGSPSARLTGLATSQGSYPFTIEVTDSAANTDTQALNLDVTLPPMVFLTGSPLPTAVVGQRYSVQVEAMGGTGAATPGARSRPTRSPPG